MTTATDWGVTWTDTGSHAVVTGVDVTSAATPDAPVRVGGWTPNPNHYIPEHVAALLAPTARNTPARSWARMSGARSWPQIPDTALTEYGRAQAEYDSAHQQIQDLRDLAFWAETQQRKIVSQISERYTDRREALLSAYEAECERLKARVLAGRPLDQAPGLAGPVYGGHVYTQERGYVEAEPPPADRSGLDKLRDRVPTALTTGETATQVGASSGTSNETPPRVGGWRVWAASAAIGIVGLAATIGALVVWA